MNRLRFTSPGSNSRGMTPPVISVLSGKGGVGKSVLAFNLAERMAASGLRVLAIDADFSGGNLHILANCNCDVGIGEFVDSRLSLAEAVTTVSSNLDLLGMSHRYVDTDRWSAPTVARFLDRLRSEATGYNAVVIDHSSGKSHAATLVAHGSDVNLLVVVPELTSISDAYGLFKHLHGSKASPECRLVINRAMDAEEADHLHKKFGAVAERFVGIAPRCIGFVLEDKIIRQAVAAQSPAAAINSESPAVQALNRISGLLLRDLLTGVTERSAISTQDNKVNPAEADIRE